MNLPSQAPFFKRRRGELPGLGTMAASAGAVAAATAVRAVQGQSVYVSEIQERARERMCRTLRDGLPCPHFDPVAVRCLSCGCWLNTPLVGAWKLAAKHCPRGHW